MTFLGIAGLVAAGQSWESLLVFLLFILVSAISSWLKRKGSGDLFDPLSDENPVQPPKPMPRPDRFAGKTVTVAGHPEVPADRKQLDQNAPLERPRSVTPRTPLPPVLPALTPAKPLPTPVPFRNVPRPAETRVQLPSTPKEPILPNPLVEPLARYESARHLPDRITERLKQVETQVERGRPGRVRSRRGGSLETAGQTVRGLDYWRRAVVAAVILDRPQSSAAGRAHPD